MLFAWTFDASVVVLIVALLGWPGLVAIGTLIALAGLGAWRVSGNLRAQRGDAFLAAKTLPLRSTSR
jgi:hypothetical protein